MYMPSYYIKDTLVFSDVTHTLSNYTVWEEILEN